MRAWPLALLLFTGCTDRWIQIHSEPEGATVYLDGHNMGQTPLETPFTWYGDREIVLEKDGYRTHTEIVEISAPWWQWPILDLLTDVILPIRFTDRHRFDFPLKPATHHDPAREQEVRGRAEELRRRMQEPP